MNETMKQIVDTTVLTPENATFFSSESGLLMGRFPEFEGRVFLALAFPFETQEEYVCVQNEEKEEIGMILSLAVFGEEERSLLRDELERKYFAPKILSITKFREDGSNSFWDCITDKGPVQFTLRDTHRSLIRVGEDRVIAVDNDGCRYEIESLKRLDRKSYAKIQLCV